MINFFVEETNYKIAEKAKLKAWLKARIEANNLKVGDINYIIATDEYVLNINKEYLDHDYYTDIITFDQSETEHKIDADIYISIDRVKDNASEQNISDTIEFHRVLIHGVLHLLGYRDKTELEQKAMREEEDRCLTLLEN
jgi:probable rRNA maturation factor